MIYLLILLAFTISALMSMIIIPRILVVALKKRLFDIPDSRKVHKEAIPRLGGLSFAPSILFSLSFVSALYCAEYMHGQQIPLWLLTHTLSEFYLLVCGVILLYLAGLKDDLVGMRYTKKFMVQLVAALLLPLSGLWINNLYGLFGIHELASWIGIPLTILVIIFITNAINLIDGIDGLASGLCSIACLLYGLTFLMFHQYIYAMLAFATLGVLVPFFYYNVFGNAEHGKKIFMGDTGSLTVGMMLCLLSLKLTMCGTDDNTVHINPMVLAFSPLLIPCCDVVRVYLHRVRNGKNPFLPDKNHIHHKLLAVGMQQRSVMIIVISVSTVFILFNILLSLYLNVNWIVLVDILIWTFTNIRLTKRIGQLQSRQATNK